MENTVRIDDCQETLETRAETDLEHLAGTSGMKFSNFDIFMPKIFLLIYTITMFYDGGF